MIKFTPIVIMTLGLVTSFYPGRSLIVKKTLVFWLLLLSCFSFSQTGNSLEDTKKQADKLFKEDEFTEAYKFYSQLVANYPKDPEYNYRLGVCMIYSEPDKKKCLPYLKLASANPIDAPKEVFFYLGKAYHINYRFDDAIKNYNEFKKTASPSLQKKLAVDREINACAYGKLLMSNLTDLVVLNKKELGEADYFRSYELRDMGGKLVVKPEEFKTKIDKKKKENSVIFLAANNQLVYFSSFGENTETGRDIYTATRLDDGTFSKPSKVAGINTEFDEDFPFLHPDGRTLYFASKGHNGMGGYDIFKTILDEGTGSWGQPQNLEFPINSPDDDFLFVTDSAGSLAYFSTGRQSTPGKIDVLKVKTERRPIDIVGVKGTVIKGESEHSLASTIIVKDLFTGNELGTFNADDEGNYLLEVPTAGKLVFTVETPGMETQSAQVTLPSTDKIKPYRQSIRYDKGKLTILNYFDDVPNDKSYLSYLNVIEKKARLEVSESADTPAVPETVNSSTVSQNTNVKPQIVYEENSGATPSSDPKKGLTNKQLSDIAKQDAVESRAEAAQLLKDSKDARELGLQQKSKADTDLARAEEAWNSAEVLTDETSKKQALEEAKLLKINAESDQAVAAKILAFSESLNEDAKTKQREAALNEQYAAELEKAITTKNDQESLPKLDALQKDLADLSAKGKESDNHIAELNKSIEEKMQLISVTEETSGGIQTNLEEIKTTLSEKESELAGTKGKKAKKELGEQIAELKTEQVEKESQLLSKNEELQTHKAELNGLKSELAVATKIKAENTAAAESRAYAASPERLSDQQLKAKYTERTVVADPNNRASVEESINQLNLFNKDIETSITKYKTDLANAKTKPEKQKLNNEITALQNTKKQNLNQISNNFNRITALKKIEMQDEVVAENQSTYLPITTESPKEALILLDELSADLKENEKANFESLNFKNPVALESKREAEVKLEEAVQKQQKLSEDITTSRELIKTMDSIPFTPVMTVERIEKEVAELEQQAAELRAKANATEGDEKAQLITKAKTTEEKILEKNVEAAEITKNDNTMIIATNKENIQNLLKLDQLSETEKETARKLSNEAVVAFRKAVDIRAEGNSLSSNGAKLGTYSNAEEQEAEAILKQQQALEILLRTEPNYNLKPIITSTTLASEQKKGPDLDSSLLAVNAGILEIAAIKVESYRKLYQANELEWNDLDSKVKKNQTLTENNPSLKTEMISGSKKIENARKFYKDAERVTKPNDQLNFLISAVKQQNLALQQYSDLDRALEREASKPKTPLTETVTVVAQDPPKNSDIEITSPINEPLTGTTPQPSATENSSAKIISLIALAQKDTSTGDLIHYYDTYEPQLSNAEANASAKASIGKLKDLEAKGRDLDLAISASDATTQEGGPVNPVALRRQADSLLAESEDIQDEAADAKSEASRKKGDAKQSLLNEAAELQKMSEDRMFESAELTRKANEAESKSNTVAIDELLERLNNDDPSLASQLTDQKAEFQPLRSQIKNLRNDATTLDNKSAKLGAIGNAEEKEAELIRKQKDLLLVLTKKYPDYEVKPFYAEPSVSRSDLLSQRAVLRSDQFAELTNLINAFSLEYESLKTRVPASLSNEQEAVRKNAEELNAESKMLLIKSVPVTEENEKIKMLTLSSKYGGSAVDQLNSIIGGNKPSTGPEIVSLPAAENNTLDEIGKTINAGNDAPENKPPSARTPASVAGGNSKVKMDGLEIMQGNAYSNANPIPLDAAMGDGLVFRVQIGAFRTQIPNNAFRGLSPLNGETTSNGYIRYTAGNFNKVENANAVKNDLRNLGYRDAFVVAYLNGKRITIGEAMSNLGEQGISVDANAPQTAGITANNNVPKAEIPLKPEEPLANAKGIETINGLLYTIQLGVFTRQVTSRQLLYLSPIFSEQLSNGLYRYTAGIYNSSERLFSDKTRVVELGMRDAFVSAYLNGKRVPYNDAKTQQENDPDIKMESENPIVFPAPQGPETGTIPNNLTLDPTVKPFTNNVSTYPVATPDNGIKTNEEGISYKVQIGAYSKQVPDDIAAKFSSIRNWPVENKQITALYIYNVGNFTEAKYARVLREELKGLGMTDAFITVYRDGRKLYGVDAENLLK